MSGEDIDWKNHILRAGQVFTPTAPVDQESLFAGRIEHRRLVLDVINQKGQHTILYGERGVGKTSLANILTSNLINPSREILRIRTTCDSTDNYKLTWQKALEQIIFSESKPAPGFGERVKTQITDGVGLVQNDISPDSIRKALSTLSVNYVSIFAFDEFDRLPKNARRAFADTIKTLSDHAVDTTIILVGVADTVDQLIEEHQSVERALVQIQMPRMSTEEIEEIISNGMSELGMTFEVEAINQVARLAQGLPHYAHLLGLHATRAALDQETMNVGLTHVDTAIDRAINGAQHSIRSAYDTATRSPRKVNLFADVLLACAMSQKNELGYFAAQDVRTSLREVTGKPYEIPAFAKHLNDFCNEERGPILQKVGAIYRYRYRFFNPLLQPYVMMRGIKNGQLDSIVVN